MDQIIVNTEIVYEVHNLDDAGSLILHYTGPINGEELFDFRNYNINVRLSYSENLDEVDRVQTISLIQEFANLIQNSPLPVSYCSSYSFKVPVGEKKAIIKIMNLHIRSFDLTKLAITKQLRGLQITVPVHKKLISLK